MSTVSGAMFYWLFAAYVPVGFFSDSFVRFHNVVGRVVSNLIVPRGEGEEGR